MKTKISGKTCPFPGSLPHGNWNCEMQEIPIHGTSFLDEDAQSYRGEEFAKFSYCLSRNLVIWWNLFPALQCRLECEPGYVAQRTPLITCVNGEYAKGCHYLSLSHTHSTIVTLSSNWFQIWPLALPSIIPLSSSVRVTSVKGEM